jgi:hypothetical protein
MAKDLALAVHGNEILAAAHRRDVTLTRLRLEML